MLQKDKLRALGIRNALFKGRYIWANRCSPRGIKISGLLVKGTFSALYLIFSLICFLDFTLTGKDYR